MSGERDSKSDILDDLREAVAMGAGELADACIAEITYLRNTISAARALVDQQANDERLWKPALSYPHGDVQRALRRLHEVIEGKTSEECAREALGV